MEETISREINHGIFEITFSHIHPSILSQSLAPHPYTPPPFINTESEQLPAFSEVFFFFFFRKLDATSPIR